jgi:hypothetical protein
MKKLAGSEATRKRISELMSEGFEASELMRTGMRLMIEQALEAEVGEALGRGRYERLAEPARGYRNGARLGRIKTAEGVVDFAAPQVTGTPEPFVSRVRENLAERTPELERLAIEMYARGLSMRDIEVAFTDAAGRCALSKSAASQVAEKLWQDYQAFAARDLSVADIVYLFIDGVAERLHLGQRREPVLAAWGIASSGEKLLLGLYAASKEDTDSARECLRDLKARGMNDPVLVASDGAPGLIRAIEEVLASARCGNVVLRTRSAISPTRFPKSAGARSRRRRWRPIRRSRRWPRATPPPSSSAYMKSSSPAPWLVSRTTSRLASPTCVCRSPIARARARPTCSKDCSARIAAAPRSSPTPSAKSRCSNSCSRR